MGTKSKCEIRLRFIYSLWMYRFYLGHKNKLSIEFNYNLKLSTEFIYSIYICTALCSFRPKKVSDFDGLRISKFRIRDIQPVLLLHSTPYIYALVPETSVNVSCTYSL
jgi:hypothetical protein